MKLFSASLLALPGLILLMAYLPSGHSQPSQRPLALATGDLDGDGMLDLIEARGNGETGWLRWQRGNVDLLFPHAPEAQERRRMGTNLNAPFFPAQFLSELPCAPDFVAAGDFNADGRVDLIAAQQGGDSLYFLLNQGDGRFQLEVRNLMNARITALLAADINRRDGLPDIVLGISRDKEHALLIFESPEGAFRAAPESTPMPCPIIGIAAGSLDDDYPYDFTALSDNQIFILHGRDRKLSSSPRKQSEVKAVAITTLTLPFQGAGIATGDFLWTPDHQHEIAVLSSDGREIAWARWVGDNQFEIHTLPLTSAIPMSSQGQVKMMRARVSGLPPDDLLIVTPNATGIYTVPGTPLGRWEPLPCAFMSAGAPVSDALPMRLTIDPLQTPVLLIPGGAEPLASFFPAAILTVNSPLDLSDGNVNDGICDTGNATIGFTGICTLRAAIQTANALPGLDRIHFSIGGGGHIEPSTNLPDSTGPLVVDGTTEPGYAGFPRIELSGALMGNNGIGLSLTNDSVVRGIAINRFKEAGLRLLNNGFVESCTVGADPLGQFPRGNGRGTFGLGGIVLRGSNNLVGGTTVAARNLIAANGNAGVQIEGSFNVSELNTVIGNWFGLDSTGTMSDLDDNPGNGSEMGNTIGVTIVGTTARDNQVGGTVANQRNVIAGSEFNHIRVLQGIGNRIQGNYLGVNRLAAGTGTGSFFSGVFIADARDNQLGGTADGAGNLIVRSGVHGVLIQGGAATGNLVQGNHIGANLEGTLGMPNSANGVRIDNAPGNTVGGIVLGARNVISANGQNGIEIINASARENEILGNYIGMTADGLDPLSNQLHGVRIFNARENSIGEAVSLARNILSANMGAGIEISGSSATANRVMGNFIGLDVHGETVQANTLDGIRIMNSASSNLIGGLPNAPGSTPGNVISGNQQNGIRIAGAQTRLNQVSGNLIGLRLGNDTPRPNRENGVLIDNARENIIGASQDGGRNVISGNLRNGILIVGLSSALNAILGNFIGLNAEGTQAIPNELNGVRLENSQASLVGGPGQFERNTISGHSEAGVQITGGQGHALLNNYIGVDPAGTSPMPNLIGVAIENSASNAIGLPGFNTGNLISGNLLHGVQIYGDNPSISTSGNNSVVNCIIGTNSTTTANLGNGLHGVLISGETRFNTVGSTNIGGFNRIAFNGRAGVVLPTTEGPNGVLVNNIYANEGLGIDAGDDGVTPNNAGAEDFVVNFPIIDSAIYDGTNTIVNGRLFSHPERRFVLIFFVNDACDPSHHGEGQRPLIALEDNTDENGLLRFTETLPGTSAPPGSKITMSASVQHVLPPAFLFYASSEFSRCVEVVFPISGDVNGDGCVNDADLLMVLFAFGNACDGCPEDLNQNGLVDDGDLLIVLFNFGRGC